MSRNARNNQNRKFGENPPNFWRKFGGGFGENGDLVKFRHRFNKNSNYMSKGAPWKVSIFPKMVI